jgi:thioredoxin 1
MQPGRVRRNSGRHAAEIEGFPEGTLREGAIATIERRNPMAENENLHTVNDADFEQQILKSDIPALVDFWAAWCGPCRAVGPVVEELAGEYAGKVKIAKLNVDENKEIPAKYGVRGIPTLMLFKNGEVFDQIVGAVPKPRIKELLDKVLSDGR